MRQQTEMTEMKSSSFGKYVFSLYIKHRIRKVAKHFAMNTEYKRLVAAEFMVP